MYPIEASKFFNASVQKKLSAFFAFFNLKLEFPKLILHVYWKAYN